MISEKLSEVNYVNDLRKTLNKLSDRIRTITTNRLSLGAYMESVQNKCFKGLLLQDTINLNTKGLALVYMYDNYLSSS